MLFLLLGCTTPPPPSAEVPARPAAAVAPAAPTAPGVDEGPWPSPPRAGPAQGDSTTLPPGARLTDLEVSPVHGRVLAVAVDARAGELWRWDTGEDARPVEGWVDRVVREVAWSALGPHAFVISEGTRTPVAEGAPYTPAGGPLPPGVSPAPVGDWRVHRCLVGEERLSCDVEVLAANVPLAGLTTGAVRWDGHERVFVGRAWAKDRWQALAVRGDGTRAYELSSPDAERSEHTAPEIRALTPDGGPPPPSLWTLPSALPRSVHPVLGALLARDEGGAVRRRDYTGDWTGDRVVATPGWESRWHPLGWYRLDVAAGAPGVRAVGLDGEERVVLPEVVPLAPPAVTGDGRAWVVARQAEDRPELRVWADPLPLGSVAFLVGATEAGGAARFTAEERARLAADGLLLGPGRAPDLDGVYARAPAGTPGLLTVDAVWEAAHAGLQAVRWAEEDGPGRERLRAFAAALQRAAGEAGLTRVEDIAYVALELLDGRAEHPEARRVREGRRARSSLHGEEVDFAAMVPTGAWAATPARADAFRARAWLDALELDPGARAALARDAALVAAWTAWVGATAGLDGAPRQRGFLDTGEAAPACLPPAARGVRVFPPPWGVDRELLERQRFVEGVGPECRVDGRPVGDGLDLLAGLGSPWAGALAPESPELRARREALAAAVVVGTDDVAGAGLAVVRALAVGTGVPAGVAEARWRARVAETALGGWTALRATGTAGGVAAVVAEPPEFDGFEERTSAPAPVLVDPVPEAWRALVGLFDLLARRSEATALPDAVPEALHALAADTRRVARLGEAQARGEPVSAADRAFLEGFAAGLAEARAPLLAAAFGGATAEPTARVVPLYRAEGGGPWWHTATGAPRRLVVLLPDGGRRVPVAGPVYAWASPVAAAPLDDAAWRARKVEATGWGEARSEVAGR